MELTDEQWEIVRKRLPKEELRKGVRGRPWADARQVLNDVLWILRTGARWSELPDRYPSYQTCHRRYRKWVREGVLEKVPEDLDRRDRLDEQLERNWGIEMIAPHKAYRKRPATQDGRKLRRYRHRHRWTIERLFAWVFNFRRTTVRYEVKLENYLGFVRLACILILMRHL